MIHLRLIVPIESVDPVLARLRDVSAVAHVVHLPGASLRPVGDVVLVDVAREAANGVVEWLQEQGVHRAGSITVEESASVVSDAAAHASDVAPGAGSDALVWEQLEARVRAEQEPTTSFLIFMTVASIIAAIGILLDAPILIVGAMVVGPEYGPLAAVCVAATRRRWSSASTAAWTLVVGLLTAAAMTLPATLAFRATGLAPKTYDLSDRQLTAFISHPDGMAAVVAVLAGIVGMLSLTQVRTGALVGVLVSVTTIPAVANISVATAYREWTEVAGAALQLGVNLLGLVVAGIATLAVQSRVTTRRSR